MKPRGFTLIELMVVMALIALLLTIVTPHYVGTVDRAEEVTLRHDLQVMRDAIDKFYSDHARYPDTLGDLIAQRYLRSLPEDPFTHRTDTWLVIAPPQGIDGKVYDIRSGARARGQDGSDVSRW